MKFTYSHHWVRKKEVRKEITDDLIEYAIQKSNELCDKHWPDASNAVHRVPPTGRILRWFTRRLERDISRS